MGSRLAARPLGSLSACSSLRSRSANREAGGREESRTVCFA
uniref:Uncharacterized protein n=1 Tax=Arundo donax TaxID=35708 RepID=A0A0A8YT41_ARUDO